MKQNEEKISYEAMVSAYKKIKPENLLSVWYKKANFEIPKYQEQIIKNLRKEYRLSDPLINIIISFTLQTKKVLSNYFCEKVAATLIMNEIKDIEEAMAFLNSKVEELLIDEYAVSKLTNNKLCNFIASYIWTLYSYKNDSLVALRHPIKEIISCINENDKKEINRLLLKCDMTDEDVKTLLS